MNEVIDKSEEIDVTEEISKSEKIIGKLKFPIEVLLRWKNTINEFKEWRIDKEGQENIIYIKEEQKALTPEELDEIDSAAYAMSRKYKYHKLMMAADIERAKIEGREVHGWMQRIFRDRYAWLLDNDVFDYAVHYALKYYNPEVFSVVKDYDFENAIINILHLPEPTNFDIFPDFVFDRFIVLTQDVPFESAVYWIENHPWTDFDGYQTTKTLAPCNFLNMGFTLWDLPVTILKDAVGKSKLFFKAKTTADQIVKAKDQILKTHIYKKRQEEKTKDEKLEESEIRYDQLAKRHQYLIDDIKAGDSRNAEEKLKDFAKKYESKVKGISRVKKIVIGVVILIIIILFILAIVSFMIPSISLPPEVPEDPQVLVSNLFNIIR